MRRLLALLPLLFALCAPAATVDLGRLGSVPASKQVATLRDLRYRDIVRQQYDFSCGSAALATLLQYGFGRPTDERALIRSMLVGNDAHTVVQQGFSMLDMKRYIESQGLGAQGFRVDAGALYRLRMPVIALLDTRGYKHFVVVKGAEAGRVFVADPALGHRVIPESDFVQGWNGIVLAVLSARGPADLVASELVNGRSSLALQRRLDSLAQASQPVPVVELGLVRGDLF